MVRVAIGLLISLYMLSPTFGSGDTTFILISRSVVVVYMSIALALLASVLIKPGVSHARRVIGMAVDISATSFVMAISGEVGTPLIAVYLWVTMGNGFRFGVNYLAASTVMSLIGFATVFLVNDFWSQHPMFSASMMIVLALLPMYMATLLRKLNDAIDQANDASRAKTQFLANMSHELRTPLNGVIGMSDLLMDTQLNKEQRELSHTIQHSAHTLLELIENILDISKIEAGKLVIEKTDLDLHALVHNTVKMFEHQAREKGLLLSTHIDPSTPFLLMGDPLHLRQVLINTVGNAVKFTEKGRVEVRVRPTTGERNETRLRFEVIDTGIGISIEDQERIFESFQQADVTTTRRFGGTGLGTAIAKQLVTLMNGDFGLKSQLGVGTLFWFELPFTLQEGVLRDEVSSQVLCDTQVLVLSSDNMARQLRHPLESWEVAHEHASSSARAFSLLVEAAERREPYRVVLVERQHLDMKADQFVAVVQGEPALRHLSLVLVDTAAARELDETFLQAGYSSVLHAPLDKALLFNAIHAARTEHEMPENVVSLAEHYQQQQPGAEQRLRVLVAEDNETNQKVLRGILERVDLEVYVVGNGEAALDVLEAEAQRFDMMILDMNMPKLGGLDVLKTYRFMASATRIPTVILSADATPEAQAACEQAGADAYLTKPVDSRKLIDIIARLAPEVCDASIDGEGADAIGEVAAGYEANPRSLTQVDEQVLDTLATLGSGLEFFKELVAGFNRDGLRLMKELQCAVTDKDYPAFQDALHALRGSAGEFGAAELVSLCVEAKGLKPFEMGSAKPGGLAERIEVSFNETCVLLTEYVNKKQDAMK